MQSLIFTESEKVIAKISAVQAAIISSQLKEMLKNVNSQDTGLHKTIKLVYHPREPFFVIKQVRLANLSLLSSQLLGTTFST